MNVLDNSNGSVDLSASCDLQKLADHYAAIPKEYGFHSQCKMTLLGDIRGKRVLDIDCRRGKGVIKLSDYVGQKGIAVGVDPSPDWIELALSYMDDAWRRNGLIRNNMDYRVGYPENLAVAGIRDGEFDLVFANSSLNLAYSPRAAFNEFFRVLRPGGMLVFDGVIAQEERDQQVVAQARAIGNSIQSAQSRETVNSHALASGFFDPEYYEEHEVTPEMGFEDGVTVPVVDSDERVTFLKTTARIVKPRK